MSRHPKEGRNVNLLEETMEFIRSNKIREDSLFWCGSEKFGYFNWDEFKKVAKKTHYDPYLPVAEIAIDLIIVGTGFWIKRGFKSNKKATYHCWELCVIPNRPNKLKRPTSLIGKDSTLTSIHYWAREGRRNREFQTRDRSN